MPLERRKEWMNAFILSQFSHCPLVWMLHSRKSNQRINRLHERALHIVYRDDVSTFDKLLENNGSFKIHERNIQTLESSINVSSMQMVPSNRRHARQTNQSHVPRHLKW